MDEIHENLPPHFYPQIKGLVWFRGKNEGKIIMDQIYIESQQGESLTFKYATHGRIHMRTQKKKKKNGPMNFSPLP